MAPAFHGVAQGNQPANPENPAAEQGPPLPDPQQGTAERSATRLDETNEHGADPATEA
ncbi:hypothetical protein FRC09_007475 [Ceratobasidium sp. 395]|nr:hypothetical protein FRC09_007475 [Ceratobasidium sp. 395]